MLLHSLDFEQLKDREDSFHPSIPRKSTVPRWQEDISDGLLNKQATFKSRKEIFRQRELSPFLLQVKKQTPLMDGRQSRRHEFK